MFYMETQDILRKHVVFYSSYYKNIQQNVR